MKLFLSLIIGYLLGSLSFGIILSRVFGHMDIRTKGSGNAGATNMFRVMGKKYGLMTFALDLLKGLAGALLGKAIAGGDLGGLIGGIGAVIGHNYPLFFGFRGGKGISTSFGALLGVYPMQVLGAFAAFLIVLAITKYVSAGSLAAAVTLPIFVLATTDRNPVCVAIIFCYSLLAIYRHRGNIVRLIHHEESKITLNRK
ncbi:MAG: glycerol-3-phosphate 1-O-acyltransferase PlsY [Clostridiales bacterium]|nr:glycerol-3-phosphate 1-O-acyltransferase PlsY [Clostridiales bacterium]